MNRMNPTHRPDTQTETRAAVGRGAPWQADRLCAQVEPHAGHPKIPL
ncbi:hypothetical protein Ae706Ps2_6435 [Pseudonocardia sp. Ae706_Ps2]|nr:hypothetical protein Ae706Ps2_6435 [Pseudonocardia sp. Ae706_Ps2]